MKVIQLNQEGRARLARLSKLQIHIEKMTAMYERDWLEFAEFSAELLGYKGQLSIKSAVRDGEDVLLRVSGETPPRAKRRTGARQA